MRRVPYTERGKLMNNDIIQNLIELLNIESYPGNEAPVAELLLNFLPTIGFDRVKVDKVGNVYATRGDAEFYPMFNAHMDSVKGYSYSSRNTYYSYNKKKPASCRWCANTMKCYNKEYYSLPIDYEDYRCEVGFTKIKHFDYDEPVVNEKEEDNDVVAKMSKTFDKIIGNGTRPIGGDDKCGIAMALQIAIDFPVKPMKLFFSVGEEIGCVGSKYAIENEQEFFLDCMYAITLDRRGKSDICVKSCGVSNGRLQFIRQLSDAFFDSNILPTFVDGASADVIHIRNVVYDCVNMSVGYEDPHSNNETVNVDNFLNLYSSLRRFVKKYKPHSQSFTRPYVVEKKPAVVTHYQQNANTYKKKETTKQSGKIQLSSWYSADANVLSRIEIMKDLAHLKETLFKGVKVKIGMEVNYEAVVNIIECVPVEIYNKSCIIKLKAGFNSQYGYLGLDPMTDEYIIVSPTLKEAEDSYYLKDNLLGINFENLF